MKINEMFVMHWRRFRQNSIDNFILDGSEKKTAKVLPFFSQFFNLLNSLLNITYQIFLSYSVATKRNHIIII